MDNSECEQKKLCDNYCDQINEIIQDSVSLDFFMDIWTTRIDLSICNEGKKERNCPCSIL
ncbi:hypothetical protein BpHYR1_023740 [Brachionus plicatilis]|uniref:Uncharacterized protein n=1 Tax=Brachionus plicatilis TaxID=10195 RepID=A0A3M7RQB7_BRAPC|nr:hypothetical protein BpHYR1_023740 [Brachionus plicatilis]